MINHFVELRTRILIILIWFAVIFILLFCFQQQLYASCAKPILAVLPFNGQLIATKLTDTVTIPLKLCWFCAILATIPMLLFHTWRFIAPALYKKEQLVIYPLIIISTCLFYAGLVFAVSVILPICIKLLVKMAPTEVAIMADMSSYLDFITTMTIATGIVFQTPLITHTLLKCQILSKAQCIKNRRYVILISLVLGMLLTPPDVISQLLLAVPMWLLFELGIVFSK